MGTSNLFTDNLNRVMSEKGISGYRLCKLTGINETQIGKYRKGTAQPRTGNLINIAKALEVEVGELFKEETAD